MDDATLRRKVVKLVLSGANFERISKKFDISKEDIKNILIEAKILSGTVTPKTNK